VCGVVGWVSFMDVIVEYVFRWLVLRMNLYIGGVDGGNRGSLKIEEVFIAEKHSSFLIIP